ncbi:hypothetical protein [Pseudomonas sp. Gutcm_11s]|uniref:hypothetical protein n=1 Tax=Pseudomonas sp. Gutcm_11s TaxID=3026088 RepID=UPI002362279C|nr:hypothetical protein [Pseudomonas sp. Gutcm_11s]MDD0844589.1 hypothetical protein [Pseudomonas sp. Gutcm_11s]
MKKQLIASLILSTLAGAAFALPGNEQPPLTEQRTSQKPVSLFELSKTRHDQQPFAAKAEHSHQLFAKGQQRKPHKPRG